MNGLRIEPGKPATRYLYARAEVDREGTATFLPGAIVTTTDDIALDPPGTGPYYTFALDDQDGQRLAEVTVTLRRGACSSSGGGLSLMSAFLAMPEGSRPWEMTLLRGKKEVAYASLDVPAPSVVLNKAPVAGKPAAGRHEVAWSSSSTGGPVGHSVWYTSDEGLTWWPLAVGYEGTGLSVDFDDLPGGPAAQLRVSAVCGASEAEVLSAPFAVAPPRARVTIDEPAAPATVAPRGHIHVQASGVLPPHGPITDHRAYRWRSDLDGDLGYGYERNLVLERAGKHAVTVTVTAADGSVAEDTQTVTVQRAAARFVHVATPGTVKASSTRLDHPALNGRPEVIVLVTPVWNPPGGGAVYDDHPIATEYDSGSWLIANQDGADMPTEAAFVVDALDPGPTAFVHVGVPSGNSTYLSHPLADARADALILVTANRDPGGKRGTFNADAIGTWFDGGARRWAVFNQSMRPMPAGAAFNVEVSLPGEGVFVHVAAAGNINGNSTRLTHPVLKGDPAAMIQVSPVWNPPNGVATYVGHNIGVWYDGTHWNVFTQDGQPMPPGAAFAVSL